MAHMPGSNPLVFLFSSCRVLQKLRSQGYDVGALPPSEGDLIKTVLNQQDAKFNSTELNIAYRMKVGAAVPVLVPVLCHVAAGQQVP